jgi:hypothetical protein
VGRGGYEIRRRGKGGERTGEKRGYEIRKRRE